MHFLIDAQLPPALAYWINDHGHTSEHVRDVASEGASDRRIWEYAGSINAVIVSKDDDFFVLRSIEPDGPSVVWVRTGNTRKQKLLEWFEALFPSIISALERGERLIEIN